METKICTKCKRELPMTSEFFYRQKTAKCGFRSHCKRCVDIKSSEYYDENNEEIKTKRKEFRKNNKDRIKARSKELYNTEKNKNKRALYYQDNKEHILNRTKKWRSENKDRLKELTKDNYNRYKDKIKKSVLKWQKENKDKVAEKVSRYQHNHPDKMNEKRKRYNLRKSQNINTLTEEQWTLIKEYFGGVCCYCGQAKELQKDHFKPVSKNGETTINNIVSCCKSCNASKGSKDYKIWYKQQPFYSVEREKKILELINIDFKSYEM
jgi:5-methylcytosine-specific restriction endonuclease McrA